MTDEVEFEPQSSISSHSDHIEQQNEMKQLGDHLKQNSPYDYISVDDIVNHLEEIIDEMKLVQDTIDKYSKINISLLKHNIDYYINNTSLFIKETQKITKSQ